MAYNRVEFLFTFGYLSQLKRFIGMPFQTHERTLLCRFLGTLSSLPNKYILEVWDHNLIPMLMNAAKVNDYPLSKSSLICLYNIIASKELVMCNDVLNEEFVNTL